MQNIPEAEQTIRYGRECYEYTCSFLAHIAIFITTSHSHITFVLAY